MAEEMVRLEHTAKFLQQFYGLDVTVLRSRTEITAFYNRCSFTPADTESSEAFCSTVANADRDAILHVSTDFRLHGLLFTLRGTPVAVGPFRPLILTLQEADKLLIDISLVLKDLTLRAIEPKEFLKWFEKFPYLTEQDAVSLVQALLRSVSAGAGDRPVQEIQPKSVLQEAEAIQALGLKEIMQHKEQWRTYEKQFQEDIQAGNLHGALKSFRKMETEAAFGKRIGSTLYGAKTRSTAVSSVGRLAAIAGGLSVDEADQIAEQTAEDLRTAQTADQILLITEDGIREYCKGVHRMRGGGHSVLVDSVVYALEHQYATRIDLAALAKDLDVSKAYLAKQFQEEMGSSPTRYLMAVRMRKAAELLEKEDLSPLLAARAVGMTSTTLFSKEFEKEYHQTPMEYRDAHRQRTGRGRPEETET